VPDQKPPRLAGDEREVLMALLRFQRDSLLRKIAGLDEEAARRGLVGSGTTLLWLVKHLTQAELLWIAVRFAGQDMILPEDTVQPSDTVESVSAQYRAASERADAIAAAASLDEPCRRAPGPEPVPLRWVLMHMLAETARHAGHADILRELIDGSTGR
jgi:uncharacterized damage-inducible protein DinB